MAHKVPTLLLGALTCALALGPLTAGSQALAQVHTAQAAPNPSAPVAPATTPTAGAATESTPGLAALKAGKFRDAQRLFEADIVADYSNVEAHFGLGLALYGLNDLTGARFEFGQMAKLAPERFEAPYNLGVIASKTAQYDEALAQYVKAFELAQGKASPAAQRQVLDALTGEQARRGAVADLVKTLDSALKLAPDDAALLLRAGQANFAAGDSSAALPLAYAAHARDPQNADPTVLIADIYLAQKLPDRALRELDAAIAGAQDGGSQGRLTLKKGQVLAGLNRAKEAGVALQAAAKLLPRDPAVRSAQADLAGARGDRAGAVSALREAVKLQPESAALRARLAGAELDAGQPAAARQNALLALKSGEPVSVARAQYLLGVMAYRAGRYGEARKALQISAQTAPDAGTLLWLGLSAYAQKDYPAAVAALEASVKADPSVTARANLGAALLASGRYQDAESVLRGVTSESPKNAEAWYYLGWSVRSQGREADAKQAFKTALALGYAQAREAIK